MNPFAETAFYWLVWRAILIALISTVLLVTHYSELTVALLVAGHISLVCALVLMADAGRLTGERVVRTSAWRSLSPRDRPSGEGGRRWACNCLRDQMLRFAKAATAVAVISSAGAIAMAGA